MPYSFLTFSDLYEEQQRASAPSSPTSPAASLHSPVFLLPTNPAQYRSYRHLAPPSRSPTQSSVASRASSTASSSHHHHHAEASTSSSTSDSSSAHHRLATSLRKSLSLWKREQKKSSWRTASSSSSSSPSSSCCSSVNGDSFSTSSSPTSSANTSPSISRVHTKMSDYDAMLERTRREEQLDEQQRQRDIQNFFAQADASTSLRRF